MEKKFFSIIILFILIFPLLTNAQNRSGAFTVTGSGYSTAVVTDYQCVGINPSNLGWKRNSHTVNVGLLEAGFSIYSEPLKRSLLNELFSSNTEFTNAEREQAIEDFTESKLQVETNINLVGFSYQHDKIGGFAFTVKERIMWDSYLNENGADILFNGYNSDYFDGYEYDEETGEIIGGTTTNPQEVSELFEGTRLELMWLREFNFSYGRQVFETESFTLYAGVGLKYLKGYSMFSYAYKDGSFVAVSAINPIFGVEYDAPSPSKIDGNKLQPVGNGWGLDFGISALIFKKLRIAASLTDFGKMTWDGNVYTGENDLLTNLQSPGLDNYNLFDMEDNAAFDNLQWGGWEGLEEYETDLPLNLRLGGAYILNPMFEFGAEFYVPLNESPGSYDKLMVGLGTRVQPVKWIRASAGLVTGGNTGTDIPVGISFLPFNNKIFSWEMGIAVGDVTSYFVNDKPTVSFAMGLLRFSFGSF